MSKLTDLLGIGAERAEPPDSDALQDGILQEEQKEQLEQDKSILEENKSKEEKLQRQAERQVQSHAEDSITKLHVIQMGRCPQCGEHLRRHLFASICEACGWHNFDKPRNSPVKVHLNDGHIIEGDRSYSVKTGAILVLKDDLVIAKVSRDAINWTEYIWSEDEIDQRHRQVVERLDVACGWCASPADPEVDGFHLVHIAFGATQERYCLCSDDCYEAFRKMYPSRVHRDCYERSCADCNLCIKRYGDEADGIRTLAKDYLAAPKKA